MTYLKKRVVTPTFHSSTFIDLFIFPQLVCFTETDPQFSRINKDGSKTSIGLNQKKIKVSSLIFSC